LLGGAGEGQGGAFGSEGGTVIVGWRWGCVL
jgi:hypothetical protein